MATSKRHTMNQKDILDNTANHVRKIFTTESSGHDWWHIYRVWQLAKLIGQKEKADLFVVELAALLHDIADHKFHGSDSSIGPKVAGEWLTSINVENNTIKHIQLIISQVSFKQGHHTRPDTLEGQIVQDADRLDAMGAIGIARAFAMGAKFGETFHNPHDQNHTTKTVINHFHHKLLKLKDLINTESAKEIAHHRHQYMLEYLDQFQAEWLGEA